MAKLIICMGVSGSGKSTLANFIAKRIRGEFLEADDFHPPQNIKKMTAGLPLTDRDREPWIAQLCNQISNIDDNVVMAYSGLRASHRKRFKSLNKACLFLYLDVTPETSLARLSERDCHFMPPSLIVSQFEAMESQTFGESIFKLDGNIPFDELKIIALKNVKAFIA